MRFTINGQAAVDVGGVRRQIYTKVFIIEGPDNFLRPVVSAEVWSSGL